MTYPYGSAGINFNVNELGGSQRMRSRDGEVAKHLSAVFGWMMMATGVTGAVSYGLSGMDAALAYLMTPTGQIVSILAYFGTFILCLGSAESARRHGRGETAILLFLFFAVATGVLLTPIFTVYTLGSVASTFFTCTVTFGFFACFGFFTKINLLQFKGFFFMALIGLIVSEVMLSLSMAWGWMPSEGNMLWYHLSGGAGVLIFVGLTAYDAQRIKMEALTGKTTIDYQILSALDLYLDFINLFLYLLRFLGERK